MFCKESHNNHLDHYDGWFKYSLAARGAFEEILQQYAHMASFKTVLSHISTSNFRKPTWNECSIIHCSLGLVCTINMFCFCLKKKLTYWLLITLILNTLVGKKLVSFQTLIYFKWIVTLHHLPYLSSLWLPIDESGWFPLLSFRDKIRVVLLHISVASRFLPSWK